MSRRNALVEWLDQTKKLAKARDYAFLELVDRIFEVIPFIDRKVLLRYKDLFNDICTRYHKPNPLTISLKRSTDKKISRSFKSENLLLSNFVESSLVQADEFQKDVLWQWFEIIDFIFERPELINPKAIDEYTEERINYVCATHRKNNPLTNGVRKRLGTYWKDGGGHWHKERRKRF